MKKIISIFIIILSIISAFSIKKTYADINFYGKIENTNISFYGENDKNNSLFELPYSYFVEVENVDGQFYKCTYDGINGYVKKSDITLMNGIPKRPYANATFKVFVSNFLYSLPNQTSMSVCQIESTDILKYYGTKNGQQISSTSNVWYYCSTQKDGQTFYGYVFSGITDNLSTISLNTEIFDKVSENDLQNSSPYSQVANLSTKTKILLIISISLPSVLILYFLIKPSRIQVTKSKKQIKTQRKIRHKDYYEFDENDI